MNERRAANPTDRSTLRAVVFDLDGTLVDTRAAVVDAVAAGLEGVMRRHGIEDFHPDRSTLMAAMGLPADVYYRSIVPANLLHLAEEVQAAATRCEVDALERGDGRLYPGVLEMLDGLRSAGQKVAVISNAQAPYFAAALRSLGLAPKVDHAECHGQLPARAPGGKAVLLPRALAVLGVPAGSACMVGDRHDDLTAGRDAGCVTIAATWGFGDPQEWTLADRQARTPAELLELVRRPGPWPRPAHPSAGG